jgi:hypothetical protein
MTDPRARRKRSWLASLSGGLLPFLIEGLVVLALASFALVLAVALLALV